jgi:hypothetical protein
MTKPAKNHETFAPHAHIIERIKVALRAQSVNDQAFNALYEPDCLEWIAQEATRDEYRTIKRRLEQMQGFDFPAFEQLLAEYSIPEITVLHPDFSPFDELRYLEHQLGAINTLIKFNLRMLDAEINSIQHYLERLQALEETKAARADELVAAFERRDQLHLRIDALTFKKGGAI